jgi:hypothetical protein
MSHKSILSRIRGPIHIDIKTANTVYTIIFDLSISMMLVLLSLRTYIFSNGYYAYQDQAWVPFLPVTIGQHPGGLFTPFVGVQSVDIFALFHDFYTFPYVIFSSFSTNYIIVQKTFIIYSFLGFIILLFIASHLLIKLFQKLQKKQFGFWKSNLISVLFVLIAYSNFPVMDYNVDGGTFSTSLEFSLFLIALLLIYSEFSEIETIFLLGGIFSLSLFLDASLTPLFLFFLLLLTLFSLLIYKDRKKFIMVIAGALLVIPVLIYVSLCISLVVSPFVPIERPFGYSYALAMTRNLTPFMVLMQMGIPWPIMGFGPPTIMLAQNNISYLPTIGFLPQILLPSGLVTPLWILSVISVTLVGFITMLFKTLRKLTIPLGITTIFFIMLSMAFKTKIFDDALTPLTKVPFLGSEMGEVLALPSNILLAMMLGIVILYTLLFSILITNAVANPKIYVKRIGKSNLINILKSHRKQFLVFIIVLMFIIPIFSYWQSFNGSYYPDGTLREGYVGNNRIPNAGPFMPFNYSQGELNLIKKLVSTDENGSFGIYWPGVPLDGPTGFANQQTISYLIKNLMLGSMAPFLYSQHVKYIVAWNLSNHFPFYNEGGLSAFYGTNNFSELLNVLNSTPGLTLKYNVSGFYVYCVKNFSSEYFADLPVYQNSFSSSDIPLYSMFRYANITPVFLYNADKNWNMYNGDNPYGIYILTPLNISSNLSLSNLMRNVTFFSEKNLTYFLHHNSGQTYENWTFADWSPWNVTFLMNDSSITLDTPHNVFVTVSYNGAMTSWNGGLKVNDTNITSPYMTMIRFSYSYESTGNISNTPFFTILGYNNRTVGNTFFNGRFPFVLGKWVNVSYSYVAPPGLHGFTVRIDFPGMPGKTTLKNITMGYSLMPIDYDSPFGSGVKGPLNLTLGNGKKIIEYGGSGTINNIYVHSNNISYMKINSEKIMISNNITIYGIIGFRNNISLDQKDYVVPFSYIKNAILKTTDGNYPVVPTLDGSMAFLDVKGEPLKISSNIIPIINYGYIAALSYSIVIIVFPLIFRKIRKKS